MRLICPNCDAQYEVGDGVIPLDGRDVQCSNCGQTWFQSHPQVQAEIEAMETDLALAGEDDLTDPDEEFAPGGVAPEVPVAPPEPTPPAEALVGVESAESGTDDTAEPAEAATAEPVVDAGAEPVAPVASTPQDEAAEEAVHEARDGEPADEPQDWGPVGPASATDAAVDTETVAAAGPVSGEPKRRSLDEAVLSVLREEADREARARRAAAIAGLETQADLNLPAPPATKVMPGLQTDILTGRRPRPVAGAMAATEPMAADEKPEAAHRSSRRDLLPDIEEINSTLRASTDKGRGGVADILGEGPDREGRGGFRRGFTLMLAFAVVLAAIYLLAPKISAQVPALDPAVKAYVATVDAGRLWLDGVMKSTLESLKSAPAE